MTSEHPGTSHSVSDFARGDQVRTQMAGGLVGVVHRTGRKWVYVLWTQPGIGRWEKAHLPEWLEKVDG